VKNLSLIINAVLSVAVIILFALHFSGNKAENAGTKVTASNSNMAGKIAYINIDTLQLYYTYFDDMKADLDKKTQKLEKDMMSREQSLQQKAANFQRRAEAGLMSRADIETKQKQLMIEGEDYQRYKQSVLMGLQAEQGSANDSLFQRITGFLEKYNQEKDLDYILGWSAGSAILHAKEALDITTEVIDGLNAKYKEDKDALEVTK
jgi:outer membrane protein